MGAPIDVSAEKHNIGFISIVIPYPATGMSMAIFVVYRVSMRV